MSESFLLVHGALVDAHVILEEVRTAMDNESGDVGTRHNVQVAYDAINELIENPEDLAIVSEDLDYQDLVMKLQLKANPIEIEAWDEA